MGAYRGGGVLTTVYYYVSSISQKMHSATSLEGLRLVKIVVLCGHKQGDAF